MKSILERTEVITKQLSKFNLKDVKLIKLKVAQNNPDTGNYRLRAILSASEYIEIFEFFFLGELKKYSYAFIKNDECILRYDNAPHYKHLKSHPHHKHLKNNILALENHQIITFCDELKNLL
ncbi:MAG: toxin-antitoxin system TumE family protein [Candidatus Helarchaeota archaeon]